MMIRRVLRALNYVFMVGFLCLALLPLMLFATIQPWILGAILLAVAAGSLLGFARARPYYKQRLLRAVVMSLGASVVMFALEGSGVFDPALDPPEALSFEISAHAEPLSVRRGDSIFYRATVTNTSDRDAPGRVFEVEGQPHDGYILYVHLPIWNALSLKVVNASARIEGTQRPITVVYSDPGFPTLNPSFWPWETEYRPQHRLVGVILGDGTGDGALPAGATLELTYEIRVPENYGKNSVRSISTGIGYSDPVWGAHRPFDVWRNPPDRVSVLDE